MLVLQDGRDLAITFLGSQEWLGMSTSLRDMSDIELVRGPFRKLEGFWRFEDLDEGGCEVTLDLEFVVSAGPFAFMFSAVFEEMARQQLNAFVKRAKQLYG